jgi:hypothetical protein
MEERVTKLEVHVEKLDERLSLVEINDMRTRQRLHSLESDRAAVRHLTALATDVFEAAKKMEERAEQVIEETATKAVEKAFRRKTEMRWQLALRVSAILGAVGAIGYLVFALATTK